MINEINGIGVILSKGSTKQGTALEHGEGKYKLAIFIVNEKFWGVKKKLKSKKFYYKIQPSGSCHELCSVDKYLWERIAFLQTATCTTKRFTDYIPHPIDHMNCIQSTKMIGKGSAKHLMN